MKHTSIFLKAACRRSIALLCTAVLFTASVFSAPLTADAASPALVILSRYHATLKIGDSFTLAGIASNGKWVRFKSSKSAVASVNTYGRVTAKKAGTCTITGKVAGGEASCKITVTKTIITLSTASITMENGAQVTLKGRPQIGHLSHGNLKNQALPKLTKTVKFQQRNQERLQLPQRQTVQKKPVMSR